MLEWLRRPGTNKALSGTPVERRAKSYSAQTGYVYTYYYAGRHESEYVFEVSPDAREFRLVAVVLPGEAVEGWERAHRALTATERYAIAKMALFQAFDEREPRQIARDVLVRRADAEAILETLGID